MILSIQTLKAYLNSTKQKKLRSQFTYRQLDNVATCLGRELACAIKVAPVDEGRDETPLVAVMMTRGIGLVSAILGILKAGAGDTSLALYNFICSR